MKFKGLTITILALLTVFIFTACAPKVTDDNMVEEKVAQENTQEEQKTEIVANDEEMEEVKSMDEFNVVTLDGQKYDLFEQKTYVKVWASWCSICLAGLGEVDELSTMDNDFRVVTIVSPGNFGELNEEEFKEWWAGLSDEEYPNLEVLIDTDAKFFSEAQIRAFPTSVYIDSNRGISEIVLGHNANDMILTKMMEIE